MNIWKLGAILSTSLMVVFGVIAVDTLDKLDDTRVVTITQYVPETVRTIERVEVPVEVVKTVKVPVTVTETVTEYVEVPGPVQYVKADDSGQYESGYFDGRIEGEDWVTSALTRPCVVEDDINCYWNAATMGNGTGDTYVNVNGETFYLKG